MAVKTVQVILNGMTYELEYNADTGNYEKVITAPEISSFNVNSEHYYPVTVKATDYAGNTTTITDSDEDFGNELKLYVIEIVKPVITVTYPTEGAYLTDNKPRIEWKVTDNDSGVDPETIGITINSGEQITSGITKTVVNDGYMCYYDISDSLEDGNNTIYFDALDYDGNVATQRTVNFIIDTIPPTLSIFTPENNLATNQQEITLAGTTNDVTSSPVSVSVKVNENEASEVSVGTDGNFSTVIVLRQGVNTIIVTAVDAAGKTSSVTRTVTLDINAPEISSIEIIPNPVNAGNVINITVIVTD